MHIFKKITALFLCTLCICTAVAMTACSGDASGEKVTATIDDIFAATSAVMPDSDKLVDVQPTHLTLFFGDAKAEDFANYKIVQQAMSKSIDQLGIFEAKELSEVKKIETMVDTFLDYYENEVWDDTYLEEEFPKLQNAQRVTAGQYVLYIIADDATRASVISAFENATK